MKLLSRLLAWFLGKLGRAQQENRELGAGLEAVRRANEAAQRVNPDQKAIDEDPANLDRPR